MSYSLYELSNDYLSAFDFLTDPENEVDKQVVSDTLEAISGDFEDKAINVAKYLKNLESSAKAIKEAEAEMMKRRKSFEKRVAGLKDYLKGNLEITGIKKIESPFFKISIAKNPVSVFVSDESIIPDEFFETRTLRTLNKTALKKSLQDGFVIHGAELKNGTRLNIK